MSGVEYCRVTTAESGQKIFSYLKRRMGRDFPDSGLMRLIRTGQVRINKHRCKPFDRVCTGDTIRIPPYFSNSARPLASPGPVKIVYENSDFLALNKPGDLPVHPGTGHKDSLVGRVQAGHKAARFAPTPIHRLDKKTTGLVLFARTYSWLRQMQDIWSTPETEKIYLAWVRGSWKDKTYSLEDHLIRGKDKVRPSVKGKKAMSQVCLIINRVDASLLGIRLVTGRTHQIRVQLAERGFPVIGDDKYGMPDKLRGGMYLHCFRINWPGYQISVNPDWDDQYKIPTALKFNF